MYCWEKLTPVICDDVLSNTSHLILCRHHFNTTQRRRRYVLADEVAPVSYHDALSTLRITLSSFRSQNVTLTGTDWFFCWMYGISRECTASLCGSCKRYLETHQEHYDKHANSQVMMDSRKRAARIASDDGKPKQAGNRNGGGARRSRRPTAGTTSTEKVKKTARGCQHDNPHCWHPASKAYSDPKWRRKNKCRPSLRCSNCKEFV